uniref:Phenazine biosynthesis protein PhzF like n=1 Tax=uncultured Nocardioidaceae bacterium TaxID=253824 RepID=A0A6J4LNT2_9ACTN|nr:MAG: Phenazine biosynthesis protein PhzF like [uncultured Nocardioidaceae bacterium]
MPPDLLDYDVVDVFAERPYAGNPLAVVHGSHGLATDALQAIAREFNLSETAFPTPVDPSTYEVRIFTPQTEVPFAGHPTVGTAWVLRQRGELATTAGVQRCAAGDVGVTVEVEGARLSATARELGEPLRLPDLLACVGLGESDLHAPVRAASCGLGFVYARVGSEAVSRSHAAGSSWPGAGAGIDDPLGGICVYAVEAAAEGTVQVHARVYCPDAGVPEDPATGSAAAGLGLVLVADGLAAADGSTAYTVEQGAEIGRPSRLECAVDAAGGLAATAHVGGRVQPVARGTLIPPRITPRHSP